MGPFMMTGIHPTIRISLHIETFAEHLFLFTFKEGEKWNRMNILTYVHSPYNSLSGMVTIISES